MKKKVLLLVAVLAFSQAAFAYSYPDFAAMAPSGQYLYYSYYSDNAVLIVKPNGDSWNWNMLGWSPYETPTGDLIIPDSVERNGVYYRVYGIHERAFMGCNGLTSVTIPSSVTSIGDDAFYGCYGLTSVNFMGTADQWNSIVMSDNPIHHSHNLYLNNVLLTDLVFSDTTTHISSNFSGDTALTSVTIPNSVTSIGAGAFSGSGLTSVNFMGTADQWNSIDMSDNPIYYSKNLYLNNVLLTDLVFSDATTTINGNFAYDTALTSVTISNSVTNIGNNAFNSCIGLTSVTIPNSVTSIGNNAFNSCIGLTSVTIPNSVTSIGGGAFSGCSGLTSVTIPNSVTSIGNNAFNSCIGLTSVTIPNSVTSIGHNVFAACYGLTSVVFNAESCVIDCGIIGGSYFLFYPVFESNVTSVTFGNDVRSIPSYLCYGLTGLTSVTIPSSVTYIGKSAFYSCSGLTSLTIPSFVTSIGDSAFSGCSGMTSMKFIDQMPPQLGTDVFEGIPTDIPVYIPCGRIAYYVNQMPQFSNFIETMVGFSAVSDDTSMGTVQVLTAPSCTDHNAVLNAVPADGYRFDHWSTGSTDNPYTLTVSTDTTIIAYFVSGGTQGIGEVEEDDFHINVFNGRICVEGITNEEVRVYDITGRMVQNHSLPSGVYIVKVGTLPAQKVVVMR